MSVAYFAHIKGIYQINHPTHKIRSKLSTQKQNSFHNHILDLDLDLLALVRPADELEPVKLLANAS